MAQQVREVLNDALTLSIFFSMRASTCFAVSSCVSSAITVTARLLAFWHGGQENDDDDDDRGDEKEGGSDNRKFGLFFVPAGDENVGRTGEKHLNKASFRK